MVCSPYSRLKRIPIIFSLHSRHIFLGEPVLSTIITTFVAAIIIIIIIIMTATILGIVRSKNGMD